METKKRLIMKKEYISPGTHIVDVELHQLMYTSLDSTKTGSQSISVSNEVVDEFTSRRHDIWDDEEDEDF